ncbi:MAG: glycosyltransferase family 4 protein [Bacilli bacterium]
MRIGLFTDTYPPYINGVSTSVFMLKQALEKKGHEVFVVTINNESMKFKVEENNHIIRISGIPTGIYDYRLSGIYPVRAINIIKNWKLDVIHSHTEFGVGTFARLIAKQFNIPLVHTYHTMYEDYIHYITKGFFNKSSKKILEYLTLFYCDKTNNELIVPTKKTYDLFKNKYKVSRNVHIIPTGIEIERFFSENIDKTKTLELKKILNIKKENFTLVFVGRIAQEKNILFLLDAIREVYKKTKKIRLIIIGDGPDKEKYEKYVTKYKLNDIINFIGKVPWESIPIYYHVCDAFITASTSETQGLTVIEAQAAGIPPLCIDDESFTNVVVDGLNGKIFKNKRECIKVINELSENKDELKVLSDQARISSLKHSSRYYAERVLDVYNLALGDRKKKRDIMAKIKEIIRSFSGKFNRSK